MTLNGSLAWLPFDMTYFHFKFVNFLFFFIN